MRIRPLSPSDVPACLALAAAAGGEPDETGWRLLLSVGEAHGVDAPGGGLAAAIAVCDFGDLAMAGPPLVAPAFAGTDLALRLVERAVARAGAAPLGIYAALEEVSRLEALGFRQTGFAAAYTGEVPAAGPPAAPGLQLRPMGGTDFAPVAMLDEDAFGASRRALLEQLLPVAERVCLAAREGRVAGYGVAWPRGDEVAVGPVVAEEAAVAAALVSFLAAGHDRPVRLDVPAGAAEIHALASEAGLRAAGTTPLMVLGAPSLPGRRGRIRALAARAFG